MLMLMTQQVLYTDSKGLFRLAPTSPVHKLTRFLDSPRFVALVCLLAAFSNLFGADLLVYSLYIVFALCIALFGTDFLPLMTIVICCYVSPSVQNNPGKNGGSIFFPENGGFYLLGLFLLFLVCTVYRLIKDKSLGGREFLKRQRKLLPGMLLLGGAYLLGGIGSGRYWVRGILAPVFALLQFASVAVPYWFFAGAVHWSRVRREYFAWVGLGVGLAVCCEAIGIYAINDVIINGGFEVRHIYTGWGNKNNVGAIIAMMIPFGVSLARQKKWGWLFNLLTLFQLLVLCFTCSRTSIFFGILVYFLTLGFLLTDAKSRKTVFKNVGITTGTLGLAVIILFYDRIFAVIGKFWNWDFASVGDRFEDYQKGLQAFAAHPFFGETFYPSQSIYEWSTVEAMKAVLPARWHNTVIQLLASCGLTGLACYCIHRFQTLRLFWLKRRTEVVFIGISTFCLLMMSLLDCHFFNIGPTLFYSMGLAFAEKTEN